MPVVKVDADRAQPEGLIPAARALPGHAPLIVMIHGFRYSPAAAHCDPHRHILSLDPDPADRRVLSWPRPCAIAAPSPAPPLIRPAPAFSQLHPTGPPACGTQNPDFL